MTHPSPSQELVGPIDRLMRWANGATSNEVWGRQSRPAHIGSKRADLRAVLSAQREAAALIERQERLLERVRSGLNTIIAEDGPGYPYGMCADTARALLSEIEGGRDA